MNYIVLLDICVDWETHNVVECDKNSQWLIVNF